MKQMMIQMSIWMKKKIQNKDEIYVEMDEVITIYFNLYEIFSLNNLPMWVNYMFLCFVPCFYILCYKFFIMSNMSIMFVFCFFYGKSVVGK
jgi:hypothetical protein